jgi:hypothetical protein
LLDAAKIAAIRLGSGYLDAAGDLIALSGLFAAAWSSIEGKTTVTRDDIDLGASIGTDLVRLLAKRDADPEAAQRASDRKVRAYTRFVTAYEEARRAIAFLRWYEGDLESIAPSLFSQKRPRRASTAPSASPQTAPESPAVPAPTAPTVPAASPS